MARILFLRMIFRKFLVSTIFFTIMNIFFFTLHFDLFSIIAKEVY